MRKIILLSLVTILFYGVPRNSADGYVGIVTNGDYCGGFQTLTNL